MSLESPQTSSVAAPSRRPVGATSAPPLLSVEGLRVAFDDPLGGDPIPVLRGVTFEVRRGEVFALVGESGSGKSLTALALMGLLPAGALRRGGRIELAGAGELDALGKAERRALRGRRMAMIFQEPASALNPVLSIGFQIIEVLRLHRGLDRRAARHEATRLLERVAMPDAEARLGAYPHQLSGGQQQRAMIAMALAGEPDLLLADEPTTALDVTVQAQVLDLLLDLRRDLGLSVLLITHDLGVVAEWSDRVGVMYAGEVVEQAPVEPLFESPSHPYTRALLRALPRLGAGLPAGIPGRVPEPGRLGTGCAFAPRCGEALERCHDERPDAFSTDDREVRCWLAETEGMVATVGADSE